MKCWKKKTNWLQRLALGVLLLCLTPRAQSADANPAADEAEAAPKQGAASDLFAAPKVRLGKQSDGSWLAYQIADNAVILVDDNGQIKDRLSNGSTPITAIAVSPDGRLLGVHDKEGGFGIWNLETKKARTLSERCEHFYSTLAFSPDSRLLATATCGGLAMWDVGSGQCLRAWKAPPVSGFMLRFSREGKTLAALRLESSQQDRRQKIDLWHLGTDARLQSTPSHSTLEFSSGYVVKSVEFNRDGSQIAVGLGVGNIYILDALTGRILRDMSVGGASDVSALSFSVDGKFLVSGDEEKNVRLWDVETGREVVSLPGHQARVTDFAWNADGTQFQSVDADRKIRHWSPLQLKQNPDDQTLLAAGTEPGKTVLRPQLIPQTGHADDVRALAFSPDGKLLASGGKDQRVLVWDLRSNRQAQIIAPNAGDVESVQFSSDGKTLVVGCSRGVQLWDVAGGKMRRPPERSMYNPVAVARSAPRIAYQSGRDIGIWNIAEDKPVQRIEADDRDLVYAALAINPSGELVAFGDDKGAVQLWDVASGKMTFKTEAVVGHWEASGFSPDGKVLAVADAAKTIYLWKVESDQLVLLHKIEVSDSNQFFDLDFSPDGKTLLIGANSKWGLRLYDVASGGPVEFAPDQFNNAQRSWGYFDAVAYSPDGSWIASNESGMNPDIKLWNAKTGASARLLAAQVRPFDDAFFVSNTEVLTSGGKRGQIDVWDLGKADLAVRFGQNLKYGAETMSLTADRKVLAVGRAGAIDLYEWPERSLRASLPLPNSTETWSEWPDKVLLSPDGKKLVGSSSQTAKGDLLSVWDVDTRTLLFQPPLQRENMDAMAFSPDGKLLAWSGSDFKTKGEVLTVWRVDENREAFSKTSLANGIHAMAFSPDGKTLLCGAIGVVELWDVASGQLLQTLKIDKGCIRTLGFSPDGKTLLCGADSGRISLWNVADWSAQQSFVAHADEVRSLAFSPDGTRFVSAGSDGIAKVWEYSSLREMAGLISNERGQWMITAPQGFYRASQRGLSIAAFRFGAQAYPVEQFDLRLNRPDEVLKSLEAGDELIATAHAAYLKRLRRMKLTPEMLNDDFHLPAVELVSTPPLSSATQNFDFKVRASDDKYTLDRLNIFVNDVPIYGTAGINLKDLSTQSLEREITLPLSSGANKIQISTLNAQGVESLRETFEINCTAPTKPTLHVFGIGVSQYADASYNLTYAAKDATDLSEFFAAQKKNFMSVKVHSILDSQATRENILAIKNELMKTGVDDEILLFFAGHGLLDDKDNYFFATHDVDFSHPEKNGLSYEAIENLLDGIPARKKLLMMDTCHSGEVDQDDLAMIGTSDSDDGVVKGARGTRVLPAPRSRGIKTSSVFLPELFADLRRGSGAQVIAAAGGLEFSLESPQWKNGVFTFSVLEGLKTRHADADKNDQITVSELRDYVSAKVLELTHGRQKPTARRENLESDFTVF